MRLLIACLILSIGVMAAAQQVAGEDDATEAQAQATEDPCAPPAAGAPEDADAADGSADAAAEAAGQAPLPDGCAEVEPGDDSKATGDPEETDEGEQAGDEEAPEPILEDFTPSEEISEDYPVPLPSDI